MDENVELANELKQKLKSLFAEHHKRFHVDIFKQTNLIERWTMKCDTSKCKDETQYFIKTCVFMRALYSEIVLLPAYKLFRSRENLSYHISVDHSELMYSDDMKTIKFACIDTPTGNITLHVQYVKNLSHPKVV
jgi:hypothetical protein